VLDVPVPEIVLQCAGIAPIVGELVTTAMPQLMRMDERTRATSPIRASVLRTPASIIGALRSVWKTWCRLVVAAAAVATTHTSSPASGWRDGTLTRGCRHLMGRNEGRYRFAARPKLHRAALKPASRFLLGSACAFLSSGIRPR
jgi:hypothetical protein